VWSPDGSKIAFNSDADGPYDIYVKDANGEGDERVLYSSNAAFKNLTQWTDDGRYLVFDEPEPATGWDVWVLPANGGEKPTTVLHSRYNEQNGHVSPDGKWIAFVSDESGRPEVYVTSFPTPGARYQVSTSGGVFSGWSQDGKSIGFVTPDGMAYLCDATTSPSFHVSSPRLLFKSRQDLAGIAATRDFRRYIQVIPTGQAPPVDITVEVNWAAALGKN